MVFLTSAFETVHEHFHFANEAHLFGRGIGEVID